MNQVVAFECGELEAVALLKENSYISPADTLDQSKYSISEEEEESFKEGCIQAVNKYKFK